MPKENIYLMQCHPGWREGAPSALEKLQEYTPETIVEALKTDFPESHNEIKPTEIKKWLQKMRNFNNDKNPRDSLLILEEGECDKCGHDPEVSYKLEYKN